MDAGVVATILLAGVLILRELIHARERREVEASHARERRELYQRIQAPEKAIEERAMEVSASLFRETEQELGERDGEPEDLDEYAMVGEIDTHYPEDD